jgi:hypothetical protein
MRVPMTGGTGLPARQSSDAFRVAAARIQSNGL